MLDVLQLSKSYCRSVVCCVKKLGVRIHNYCLLVSLTHAIAEFVFHQVHTNYVVGRVLAIKLHPPCISRPGQKKKKLDKHYVRIIADIDHCKKGCAVDHRQTK